MDPPVNKVEVDETQEGDCEHEKNAIDRVSAPVAIRHIPSRSGIY
jgi:hypothetical protein